MFTTLKKQIFMLFLVIGMIAPVSAMDSHQESSGWFGWKSVACITALAGAGALWAYHQWTKPAPTRSLRNNSGTKKVNRQEEAASGSVSSTLIKSREELEYEKSLAEFKPEFVASEMKRLETLIAQLEQEIAQEQNKK